MGRHHADRVVVFGYANRANRNDQEMWLISPEKLWNNLVASSRNTEHNGKDREKMHSAFFLEFYAYVVNLITKKYADKQLIHQSR